MPLTRDGARWWACPTCGGMAAIDEKSYRGQEPITCRCGYREQHNYAKTREIPADTDGLSITDVLRGDR